MALPYTHIWTELLRMGISWDEALRMPWGTCRMLFEARAEAWDLSHDRKGGDDVRYATPKDVDNWI